MGNLDLGGFMMRGLILTGTLLTWAPLFGAESIGSSVSVEIRTDNGKTLPLYPVGTGGTKFRSYAEAVKGEKYTIVVHNRLNRRIGVVAAVDGRNIISGKKSFLKSDEPMYVQGPYQTGEYEGWRASLEKVNRFYFTEVADSYAAAFKDESAMGVIAVAIYPELVRQPKLKDRSSLSESSSGPSSGESRREGKNAPSSKAEDRAGTGYGPEAISRVTYVSFEPERNAVETIFLKYEWRSTLIGLGVIPKEISRPLVNRFWDEGFAPPPPVR